MDVGSVDWRLAEGEVWKKGPRHDWRVQAQTNLGAGLTLSVVGNMKDRGEHGVKEARGRARAGAARQAWVHPAAVEGCGTMMRLAA